MRETKKSDQDASLRTAVNRFCFSRLLFNLTQFFSPINIFFRLPVSPSMIVFCGPLDRVRSGLLKIAEALAAIDFFAVDPRLSVFRPGHLCQLFFLSQPFSGTRSYIEQPVLRVSRAIVLEAQSLFFKKIHVSAKNAEYL
jgi:hypothetical protein